MPNMYSRAPMFTDISTDGITVNSRKLQSFIKKSYLVPIKKLLEENPDMDLSKLCEGRQSWMSVAVRTNYPPIIEFFLKHPAVDVNQPDANGNTPLMDAVANDWFNAVRLLVADPRVDVTRMNKNGFSIFATVNYGDTRLLRLLIIHQREFSLKPHGLMNDETNALLTQYNEDPVATRNELLEMDSHITPEWYNEATWMKAYWFAFKAHKGQKRGDGKTPYITHPVGVCDILTKETNFERCSIVAVAALLHDILEDTDADPGLFGEPVCTLVNEVTDDPKLEGEEKRKAQMRKAHFLSKDAAAIKMADKLHNLRDMVKNPPVDWDTKKKYLWVRRATIIIDILREANERLYTLFYKELESPIICKILEEGVMWEDCV